MRKFQFEFILLLVFGLTSACSKRPQTQHQPSHLLSGQGSSIEHVHPLVGDWRAVDPLEGTILSENSSSEDLWPAAISFGVLEGFMVLSHGDEEFYLNEEAIDCDPSMTSCGYFISEGNFEIRYFLRNDDLRLDITDHDPFEFFERARPATRTYIYRRQGATTPFVSHFALSAPVPFAGLWVSGMDSAIGGLPSPYLNISSDGIWTTFGEREISRVERQQIVTLVPTGFSFPSYNLTFDEAIRGHSYLHGYQLLVIFNPQQNPDSLLVGMTVAGAYRRATQQEQMNLQSRMIQMGL